MNLNEIFFVKFLQLNNLKQWIFSKYVKNISGNVENLSLKLK